MEEIKTFFMQELFKSGVLVLSTHNISLAHTPKIIRNIVNIYDEVFSKLNHAIEFQMLQEELKVAPLKPLFKVR